jgi:hypothetical protein
MKMATPVTRNAQKPPDRAALGVPAGVRAISMLISNSLT